MYLKLNEKRNVVLHLSVGIGDGGNELGMGKVKEKVKSLMPNGSLVACVVPADYAVTAGMLLNNHTHTAYQAFTVNTL